MKRREMLEFSAERVTEIVERLKEECDVNEPEAAFGLILLGLVREFRSEMSEMEMTYGLTAVSMQILSSNDNADKTFREILPDLRPGNPEMN